MHSGVFTISAVHQTGGSVNTSGLGRTHAQKMIEARCRSDMKFPDGQMLISVLLKKLLTAAQ